MLHGIPGHDTVWEHQRRRCPNSDEGTDMGIYLLNSVLSSVCRHERFGTDMGIVWWPQHALPCPYLHPNWSPPSLRRPALQRRYEAHAVAS